MRGPPLVDVAALGTMLVFAAAASACRRGTGVEVTASAWPEADALFRGDPLWRGADDAYSVALGGERVLWLFADGFVASAPGAPRAGSAFIRNSVAVQTGLDPTTAAIEFRWATAAGGAPASFFPEQAGTWFWPGDGERTPGGALLVFLMAVRASSGGGAFGFEVYGWRTVRVADPDVDPADWTLEWLDTPADALGVIVGSASVLQRDGFLYAYGAHEPPPHDLYLLRWPAGPAFAGDLSAPSWWCGDAGGWSAPVAVGAAPACAPVPVFGDGQTELSVHEETALGRFLEVQTRGFGATTLALRSAPALEGPWSALDEFFRPPESDRAGAFVYAGKAHPELLGADLAVTYVANGDGVFTDETLYYPRFVRLTFAAP
ncbi:MAG TPA: DUF4185 domain-containing protein [Myxococcota bacterium]|jgi:hypothetical protein|nr:DUF4185 domain-containing protein [Myxococcota bacterium]